MVVPKKVLSPQAQRIGQEQEEALITEEPRSAIARANRLLKDRVAVVTGGGTGIGRSIALEFAKAGADVVVASRRLAVIEKVAQEIRALGRRSLAVQTDVSQKADVDNLVERVMNEFGAIDILVNNAGIQLKAPFLEVPQEDWDITLDINVKGVFNGIQAAASHMMQQRYGKIINISSIFGTGVVMGSMAAYSTAKAGVIQLTKIAARELGPYGINVNAIAPGLIVIPSIYDGRSKEEAEQHIREAEKRAVLGRTGTPEDVANVALFLASDDSSFITGQVICVDGGRMDHM